MVSADTNVLLRWALGDIPEQAVAATRLLEGDDEVRVADLAIMEMGYVLERLYGLDRELVAGYIRSVMSLGQVNCNRSLFSKALPAYEQHPQLSFADCCLTTYATLNGATPLYTFDKQLANKLPAAGMLA